MNAREIKDRYGRALALGALCGMRSMSGPVLASQPKRVGRSPLQRQLAKPAVARTLATLAAVELIADKLPFVPARTQLPSLLARAASGALTVVTAGAPRPRHWGFGRRRAGLSGELAPALAGAVAAVASASAAYYLRRTIKQRWGVSSLVGGLLEDALLLMAASRLRA
jgi:uncharacterized membrane protein